MSQRTDAQLTTESAVIRDETAVGGNTKTRVYNILKNIIDSKVNNEDIHFRGLFTSLAALESGVPVGNPGDYADVDEGADYPPTRYIWDESDLEWVAGSSGGSVTSVTGDGVDNTNPANPVINNVNAPVALTSGATIDLTAIKHTLTTAEVAITFTISYTGDDIAIRVILNATTSTFTFPAGALCISEGVASGNNTAGLAGVSGDKYVITIKHWGSAEYTVVVKNIGQ